LYVAGVGQHKMWAAQFIDTRTRAPWINRAAWERWASAVPAAMGAKRAARTATVWAIRRRRLLPDYQPGVAPCATRASRSRSRSSKKADSHGQAVADAVLQRALSNTDLPPHGGAEAHGTRIPDFVKLAEAYDCEGIRGEGDADVTR